MLQSPARQLMSKLHKAYQLTDMFHNIRSAQLGTARPVLRDSFMPLVSWI